MTKIGAFGSGGTNVSVGVVDSETGDVSNFNTDALRNYSGYRDLFDRFIKPNVPSGYPLGGCIAGAMDEEARVGTNLANSPLAESFDFGAHFNEYDRFTLCGDVRGEGQAATRWIEQYKGRLLAIATFSSGYGVDLMKEGLPILPNHIEVGHGAEFSLPPELSRYDRMPCGCKSRTGENRSHLEAYVSATASANMARRAILTAPGKGFLGVHPLVVSALEAYNSDDKNDKIDSWMSASDDENMRVLDYLTGEMVYEAIRNDPEGGIQSQIRAVQELAISEAIIDISAHYSPEVLLIKGSLAADPWNWENLFIPAIGRANKNRLADYNPNLKVEMLDNPQISVMGGAADWIRKNG